MADTITIDLSKEAAEDVERAAKAAGQTPEAFVADIVSRQARALIASQEFFAERAKGADPDALRAILMRDGGEPPKPGDEAD